MKVIPLGNRVLVKREAEETKTASGIIIPDNAKEKPNKAIVTAVGEGTKDEPMNVKEGDTVLIAKWGGTEIDIEGTEHLIFNQSDIIAKVA